jgi:hypothetical protein
MASSHAPKNGRWLTICFMCITALTISGNAAAGQEKSTTDHRLPDKPGDILISLDFHGGRILAEKNEPHLVLMPDGTVFLGSSAGYCQSDNFKITQAEIQELLEFIIDENQFFTLDPLTIKNSVMSSAQSSGRNFSVADAPVTVIRVRADGKDHTVEYYALDFVAQRFPDIENLQQFIAVQRRLQHLASLLQAGGEKALNAYLKTANTLVKQKWPHGPSLEIADLQYASRLESGAIKLRFSWKSPYPKADGLSFVVVLISHMPDAAPRYELFGE